MKVGFFGNNNNYPFLLAEAVREQGHDVVLVLNRARPLDRPESRDPAAFAGGLPPWIVDVAHVPEDEFLALGPGVTPALDALASCDALVLNDVGPSLLPLLERPAFTFLTGSDVEYYANPRLPALRLQDASAEFRDSGDGRLHRQRLAQFVERQRRGIAASVGVNWALRGLFPVTEALLAEIGVADHQLVNVQMADLRRLTPAPGPRNRPLRVLSATRLTWQLPIAEGRSALDYKGSDVMIRGIGRFCRATGQRLDVHLVRKGLHLAETEALLAAEGIKDQVTWHDEMPLAALWDLIRSSDLVFEQLGGSIVSMVALDVMACGRPVIGNTRPEVPTLWTGADCPVLQASTPAEVEAHLLRLSADADERDRIGRAGRAFVERHFAPARAAQLVLERLRPHVRRATGARAAVAAELRAAHRALRAVEERLLRLGPDADALAAAHAREPELVATLRAALQGGRAAVVHATLRGPFARAGDRGWTAPLPKLAGHADDADHPQRSRLLLFEDDRVLGPAHSGHAAIGAIGGGRYSHWQSELYFSTSDGSDPGGNGRTYTIALAPEPR
ncbi:MAG: glycosyltransferase [Planctomycetota bacterium]